MNSSPKNHLLPTGNICIGFSYYRAEWYLDMERTRFEQRSVVWSWSSTTWPVNLQETFTLKRQPLYIVWQLSKRFKDIKQTTLVLVYRSNDRQVQNSKTHFFVRVRKNFITLLRWRNRSSWKCIISLKLLYLNPTIKEVVTKL